MKFKSGLRFTRQTSITSQYTTVTSVNIHYITIALTVRSINHRESNKNYFKITKPVVFKLNNDVITIVLKIATCCNIINTSQSG